MYRHFLFTNSADGRPMQETMRYVDVHRGKLVSLIDKSAAPALRDPCKQALATVV